MSLAVRIVSVPRGEDLIEALGKACSGIEGWVQASGCVEAVELSIAGEGADPTRALRGRLTLASLTGPAGGPYGATLARATETGLEVLAGTLVRARSDGVVVAVLPVATAAARTESPRGPSTAGAEARPVAPAAPGASGSEWAARAMASAALTRAKAPPEPERALPVAGDLVQHFAFGLCEVLIADDERLKIRDLNGPGRIREIRLEVLHVRDPGERDGKRLFRLDRRN